MVLQRYTFAGLFVVGAHGSGGLVYGLVWIESLNSSLKRGVFKDNGFKMMGLSLKRGVFEDEACKMMRLSLKRGVFEDKACK